MAWRHQFAYLSHRKNDLPVAIIRDCNADIEINTKCPAFVFTARARIGVAILGAVDTVVVIATAGSTFARFVALPAEGSSCVPPRPLTSPRLVPMTKILCHVFLAAACVLMVPVVAGVMIVPGDGSGNTDAAGDAQFQKAFGNLDMIGTGGAVYIGNRFALRTRHAGSSGTDPLFGEQVIKNRRLHEVGDSGSLTDIVLMELGNDPGLPAMPIAENSPLEGTPVRLIGFGANRESNITYWNVAGDYPDFSSPDVTWIWTETPVKRQAEHSGYMPLATSGSVRFGDLRWGTNVVEALENGVTFDYDMGPNNGMIRAFATDFDNSGGTAQEAQAVGHDSGGAVVALDPLSGRWELIGLVHAASAYPNQPDAPFSAVFGNRTIASDLSVYRDQILPLIPEPACSAGLLAGVLLLRRRARHAP